MNVSVDGCRRKYKMFTRDGICRGTCHKFGTYAIHSIGVARLAYARYASILDAHISLHHTQQRVDDGDVCNDQIERSRLRCDGVCLTHTVTQGFPTAIYCLVTIIAQVALNLHIQIRVGKAYLVAHRSTEEVVVFLS